MSRTRKTLSEKIKKEEERRKTEGAERGRERKRKE